MSTYVLMRVLESAPKRYDAGIRILTFGRVDRAYDRLADRVEPGQRVLDIGCGTGALTLRAARRGATVRGIDRDPEMLAMARTRVADEHLEAHVELVEEGVAELDAEPPGSWDVVMSGLCFSELSPDELDYTLEQLDRLLKPGGTVLVADEVVPRGLLARLVRWIVRVPAVAITYLLTQQVTHAVRGLDERLREAGLPVVDEHRTALGTFASFVARKPDGPPGGGAPS